MAKSVREGSGSSSSASSAVKGTRASRSRKSRRVAVSAISVSGYSRSENSPVRPVLSHNRADVGVACPTMAATANGGFGQGRSVLKTKES